MASEPPLSQELFDCFNSHKKAKRVKIEIYVDDEEKKETEVIGFDFDVDTQSVFGVHMTQTRIGSFVRDSEGKILGFTDKRSMLTLTALTLPKK